MTKLPNFKMIVAMDSKGGIGKDNKLPWRLKGDMGYFKDVTSITRDPGNLNAVIMGRKTWESIPSKYRPLEKRINIIVSTSMVETSVPVCRDPESALRKAAELGAEEIYVIGGGKLYEECIKMPECRKLYVTHIDKDFGCDTFFPMGKILYSFLGITGSKIFDENGIKYKFNTYERIMQDEQT